MKNSITVKVNLSNLQARLTVGLLFYTYIVILSQYAPIRGFFVRKTSSLDLIRRIDTNKILNSVNTLLTYKNKTYICFHNQN